MAVCVEQLRVAHSPRRQGFDVARHEPFQTARGLRPRKERLAHVGNVEETRLLPRMEMFADDARRVLHRHGIARKANHAGAETLMHLIKRRAGEIASGSGTGSGLALRHQNTRSAK